MDSKIFQRRPCRRTDIVKMFFGIANAIRQSGQDLFWQPSPDGGAVYTFRIGENRITYSVQRGGLV